MTMPHLMNCGHSPDGWCLDCVKAIHNEHVQTVGRMVPRPTVWDTSDCERHHGRGISVMDADGMHMHARRDTPEIELARQMWMSHFERALVRMRKE